MTPCGTQQELSSRSFETGIFYLIS